MPRKKVEKAHLQREAAQLLLDGTRDYGHVPFILVAVMPDIGVQGDLQQCGCGV